MFHTLRNYQVIQSYQNFWTFLPTKNKNKLSEFLDIEISNEIYNFRHHHETGLKRLQCNTDIHSDHDNIGINIICPIDKEPRYVLRKEDIINVISSMKCTKVQKQWIIYVGERSAVLIEALFDQDIWKEIWKKILQTFDCQKPVQNKGIVELRKEFFPILEKFVETCCTTLCELPLSGAEMSEVIPTGKFSAYHYCQDPKRIDISIFLDNDFQETSVHLADLVEEGFNFLRVEASEIVAFVATDSDRILKPGIPPHIPIAYGLRGHSMSNDIVRNMRNDIRNELKLRNTSVLCEVYDGQFHDLIVRSDCGKPLTRIQHTKDFFRETLENYDKDTLLTNILPYSTINPSDLDAIQNTQFRHHVVTKLNTVTLECKRIVNAEKDNFIRQIFIESNPKGNFSMQDVVTNHRTSIWNRYLGYKTGNKLNENCIDQKLSQNELCDLIKGTKLHRRISSQSVTEQISINSDSDESSDPDYIPNEIMSEFSDNEEDDYIAVSEIATHNISTISSSSSGHSCIRNILDELKKIVNKHNWSLETIDTTLDKYFKSKVGLEKLFIYEMDVINGEIHKYFGKYLFKKSDNKRTRVKKMFEQLKQMPQLLTYTTSDEESVDYAQPKTLFKIYKTYITKSKYPKEYLAAVYCKINHYENVMKWEKHSKIAIKFDMPWVESEHIIFNYPDYSVTRNQMEMRTFDYTHILNNLRFHICNRGFEDIRTEAFLHVSDIDHEVLPRAIVEDKMD